MQKTEIAAIEQKIGYVFKNKSLLTQSFVHSSFANAEKVSDNERMEFFGDAVLDFIVSEYIYSKYPNFDAGVLSKVRSSAVSADGLRPVVDKLGILDHLRVAISCKVRTLSKKIEANLYEAVLCAIYFDGGLDAARQFVMRTLKEHLDGARSFAEKDSKTLVQEYCQERKMKVEYKFERKTGPDNRPTFYYSLWVDGKKVSSGSGSSIKNAERDAASKIVKEWRISQCYI